MLCVGKVGSVLGQWSSEEKDMRLWLMVHVVDPALNII
jgi:hypothetical protein